MMRSLLLAGSMLFAPSLASAQTVIPTATAGLAAAAQPLAIASGITAEHKAAYRSIFAAIRAGDWTTAQSGIDALPGGPLTDVAQAELILAKGSPKAADDKLAALLTGATDLPEAPDLAAIAAKRGLSSPTLPVARDLVRFAGPSRRQTARSLKNDRAAAALAQQALPLLRDDRPSEGEALVQAKLPELSPEAQAEWLQRTSWSYYLTGDDA
ncbi:MAG: lytic transglycosylase domain-containing protein, partial [Alphaproteobacteria bacterium]